jgi:hypothetical protein
MCVNRSQNGSRSVGFFPTLVRPALRFQGWDTCWKRVTTSKQAPDSDERCRIAPTLRAAVLSLINAKPLALEEMTVNELSESHRGQIAN